MGAAGARGSCRAARAAEKPRARRLEAIVRLKAEPSSVLDLEAFIDSLDFLRPRERCRAKLAGDEILDNLVRHASPLRGEILVRAARRRDGAVLGFFFHSAAFASFASRCGDLEPLFDPEHRRWRGIGLVMCRNLSQGICMRPGSLSDRIFLRFALEPEAGAPVILKSSDTLIAK